MNRATDRWKVLAIVSIICMSIVTYVHVILPFSFMKVYPQSPYSTPHRQPDSRNATSVFVVQHQTHLSARGKGNKKSHGNDNPVQFLIDDSNQELETKIPWMNGGHCFCEDREGPCDQLVLPGSESTSGSAYPSLLHRLDTCGSRAAADGKKQRVISLSLYGNNPDYSRGLSDILSKAKVLYPHWKVWLYTDPRNQSSVLCPLLHEHRHLRICDVTNLPPPLSNIVRVHPAMWRIAPLGDPTVETFIVRDSDSELGDRERSAVQDWLDSGKSFHVMRDHPMHGVPVMGGMWGARWISIPPEKANRSSNIYGRKKTLIRSFFDKDMRILRNQLLANAYDSNAYGYDQNILAKLLWPAMKGSVVAHDSFHCNDFPDGWRPWPTKRSNRTFVGSPTYRQKYTNEVITAKCPSACRPSKHPNWLWC